MRVIRTVLLLILAAILWAAWSSHRDGASTSNSTVTRPRPGSTAQGETPSAAENDAEAVKPPDTPPETKNRPRTISEADDALSDAKSKCLDALRRTSPEYATLLGAVTKEHDRLEEARANGSIQERLDAGAAYNGTREKIRLVERKALAADALVVAAESDLNALREQAAAEARKEAAARDRAAREATARADRLDRARQNIANLSVGEVGILPPVRIIQVIDESTVLAATETFDATLIITGVSTGSAYDGQLVQWKHPMFISKTRSYVSVLGARRTALVAQPYSGE